MWAITSERSVAEMTKLYQAVGRVEALVEDCLKSIQEIKDDSKAWRKDHDKRLKSIEISRARLKGAGYIVVVVGGAVGSYWKLAPLL